MDIDPCFAECMVEFASLKLKMKQKKEAIIYYQKAKELIPELQHADLEKSIG
jgi:hypothetical protein